jgi:hypothetical protein
MAILVGAPEKQAKPPQAAKGVRRAAWPLNVATVTVRGSCGHTGQYVVGDTPGVSSAAATVRWLETNPCYRCWRGDGS